MKPKPIVFALALAALFFAILLPPEAYPDGKLAVLFCATFAFFSNLVERRIPPTYLLGGLAGLAFLILHSVFVSVDLYRSLEFTTVLWGYYCLFGFFYYSGFEPSKPITISIVVLSAIVSGYGLYQYFWGFEQLYNYVFYANSDQVVKVPALERIATKRVFSTLALPGTLWGFLLIALPFHASLWASLQPTASRRRALIRVGIVVSAAMLLATGLLTRSFGFLLGLFTLAATGAVLKYRRIAWNRLAPVLIVLVLVGGTFYSARRGAIAGSNPLVLRAKNFVSAWTIFSAHPMGVGLNSYGVVYSRYMMPNSNETQYTHNTPLQFLSELGLPVALLGLALIAAGVRAKRRGEFQTVSPYLKLALVVWVLHNLIDIDVYFPSVGVVGVALLALLLRKPSLPPHASWRGLMPATVLSSVAIMAFAALSMISTELKFRAQSEFEENRFTKAAETLQQAKRLMPIDSSIFHQIGEVNLNLFHKRHDQNFLRIATDSFRRAVELSPEKAGSHTGLSLSLSSASRVDDALQEIRVAQRLYPDSSYVQAIAILLEQRRLGVPPKAQ